MFVAGTSIPSMHRQMALHSTLILSEPLHFFPDRPHLYISLCHSRSMLLQIGVPFCSFNIRVTHYMHLFRPQFLANPGIETA